jgi:pentatricopeptide repeat protein
MRELLIVLLAVGSVGAQQPIVPPAQQPIPEPAARGKSTQHNIVVRGCVRNGRLKVADSVLKELPFEMLNASEFLLEGPKEVLQQIKELHNGHDDEIAGIATVPPPPQDEDAAVVTSKKGPVSITAGRRDEKSLGARNAPQPIKMRVASLTHISEGCVERR